MPVDYATPTGQVRLLINDTGDDPVFAQAEIEAFLAMEGDVVKLAAALALETIAGDEALTSKVIRTAAGTSTDGAKLAAQLLAQAKGWREQAAEEGEGYFELVDGSCYSWGPELTERQICWP